MKKTIRDIYIDFFSIEGFWYKDIKELIYLSSGLNTFNDLVEFLRKYSISE